MNRPSAPLGNLGSMSYPEISTPLDLLNHEPNELFLFVAWQLPVSMITKRRRLCLLATAPFYELFF